MAHSISAPTCARFRHVFPRAHQHSFQHSAHSTTASGVHFRLFLPPFLAKKRHTRLPTLIILYKILNNNTLNHISDKKANSEACVLSDTRTPCSTNIFYHIKIKFHNYKTESTTHKNIYSSYIYPQPSPLCYLLLAKKLFFTLTPIYHFSSFHPN